MISNFVKKNGTMIQRIQSLFLLIVVVSILASMFMPVWEKENKESKEKTTLTLLKMEYQKDGKVQNTQATYYLLILAGLVVFSATYSIFRFDSRLMQMKIGLFNSLILSVLLVLSVYLVSYYGETSFGSSKNGDYGFGFFLCIVAIVSNLAANRFIRKDEKLVRSADRMR